MRFVTPGYFAAMGIPLTSGRDVLDQDAIDSPRVAVVSESFAEQFWPGRNAIGRRFDFGEMTRTVVGIVGDVRVRGLEASSEPQVYLPSRQMPDRYFVGYVPRDLVIRSTLEAGSLVPAVQQIVTHADVQTPVDRVQTLNDILDQETSPRSTQVRVLGIFAAIAFLLAGVGINGLLSFAVSHRSQEIGVRMAMGAQVRDILLMILGESLILAIIGIAAGGLLAYLAARTMEALLAGISPRDPLTFAAGMIMAFVMTMAGSARPALRAVRVDPMTVIRTE
jgi:putative ABC transport system permease protein